MGMHSYYYGRILREVKITCKSLLQLLLAIKYYMARFYTTSVPVVATGVKSSLIYSCRGKLYGRILHE